MDFASWIFLIFGHDFSSFLVIYVLTGFLHDLLAYFAVMAQLWHMMKKSGASFFTWAASYGYLWGGNASAE